MSVNVQTLYRKLLTLYPQRFKEELGKSMEQTFNDLYGKQQTRPDQFRFVLWIFIDTAIGIVREHVLSETR